MGSFAHNYTKDHIMTSPKTFKALVSRVEHITVEWDKKNNKLRIAEHDTDQTINVYSNGSCYGLLPESPQGMVNIIESDDIPGLVRVLESNGVIKVVRSFIDDVTGCRVAVGIVLIEDSVTSPHHTILTADATARENNKLLVVITDSEREAIEALQESSHNYNHSNALVKTFHEFNTHTMSHDDFSAIIYALSQSPGLTVVFSNYSNAEPDIVNRLNDFLLTQEYKSHVVIVGYDNDSNYPMGNKVTTIRV